MRRTIQNVLLLVLFTGVLAGCSRQAPAPPIRPDDGLLERPDLQSVVELQTHRDGAGLIARLVHHDPAVRARAAFALGSVQDSAAAGPLEALLADEMPSVRRDAAFALGQLGRPESGIALLGAWGRELDPDGGRAMLDAMGKVGDADLLARLVALEVPEGFTDDLALALARMAVRGVQSEDAIRRLAGWLTHRDPDVRRSAAWYFGRTGEPENWSDQAPAVRDALDGYGPYEAAAMHLLQGLGRLGAEQDLERLTGWLADAADWRVRVGAVRGLAGRTGADGAREALIVALDDRQHHVVQAAAEALGPADLTGEEAAEVRRWIASHPDRWRPAGTLLPALAARGEAELVWSWTRDRSEGQEQARALGVAAMARLPDEEQALRILGEAVRTAPEAEAAAAVGALAVRWRRIRREGGDAGAYMELFRSALQRGGISLAYTAAGAMGDPSFRELGALEVLSRAWQEMESPEDLEPMTAVLGAMGRLGDEDAERLLRGAETHPHPVLAGQARQALRRLGFQPFPAEGSEGPEVPSLDWEALGELGPRPRLVLETERGEVVLELHTTSAPLTVQTIAGLAREGSYDGVPFHRVVPNFVIQGGDFSREDGFGGPGFVIRSEFTPTPYLRGVLGMASAGKDTEGSQYFITHSIQHHLDGRYTVFGHVVEGMGAVDRIRQGDRVLRARVAEEAR